MLECRRPRAELLAVVAHHPEPRPVLGRVGTQVGDDILHGPERDEVAQPLLGAEQRHERPLVLGDVGAPALLLGDRRRAEVRVVEDRPVVPGVTERRGQGRLPDAFGKPRPARPAPEQTLELIAHPRELPDPVALGERGEDRFRPAATEDLDLAAVHEVAQPLDEGRAFGAQPLEQRTRVVERDSHARGPLERVDQRRIGEVEDLGEHPAEVADWLVVMDRKRERDAVGHVRWRSSEAAVSRPR